MAGRGSSDGSWLTRARDWVRGTVERPDDAAITAEPKQLLGPPPASDPERIGICCSGGGIRSAAYNLGALQVLQRRDILSELNVSIDIDPTRIRPTGSNRAYCTTDHVVGTITYPGGRTGRLVLAKAGVTKDAPWDVRAYGERDPAFPTHSTIDQFYTDEKFEAYRALGAHTAERAVATMHPEAAVRTTTPTPAPAAGGDVTVAQSPLSPAQPQPLLTDLPQT